MGVGVVFQLHAVFVGIADGLLHAFALEVLADGQYGQLAAVVDGALYDLAQVVGLEAVVHGDGDDLLRGLRLGEDGQIAVRLSRGARAVYLLGGIGIVAEALAGGRGLRQGGGVRSRRRFSRGRGGGIARGLRGGVFPLLRARGFGLNGLRGLRRGRGGGRGKRLRGRGLDGRPGGHALIPAARSAAGDDDGQRDDQQRGQRDDEHRQRRIPVAAARPRPAPLRVAVVVRIHGGIFLPHGQLWFFLSLGRAAAGAGSKKRQRAMRGAAICFHFL